MSGSILFRVCVPSDPSTLQVLKDIVEELNVRNPIWIDGKDEQTDRSFKQVLFYLPNGQETEEAIKLLTDNEIGVTPFSSLGLFQCYLLYQESKETSPKIKVTRPEENDYSWHKFVDSVRPRLAIAQIVESVRRKASLTFDFVILLVVAALTASLGLVEDSPLVLAASMLISPMMFPMIAATFGTVTGQWKLQKLGIKNGLLGLLLCLIIGFIFGIGASLFQGYKTMTEWPTSLMYSMGTLSSLGTGAILALFSGTAVSIGILGDDPCSIHGVAISAALLPPAVNAGLLWSRSAIITIFPGLPDNSRGIWSNNSHLELALLGAISLVLSFLNVIFIFIAGNILLKVKDVSSRKQMSDTRWEHLRKYKPFTREETEQITVRLGINPTKDLRHHHWTVTSNEPLRQKINRGLETWCGSRECNHTRPTAQDIAHHMLAPKRIWELAQDSSKLTGSRSNLLAPSPVSILEEMCDSSISPPSSRFTVTPVTP